MHVARIQFQTQAQQLCAWHSGLSYAHQFNNKRMLPLEKNHLARENKIDLSPEGWAAVTSTGWHFSGRASLSPHSSRQKEARLAGCLLWYPTIMKNHKPGHYNVFFSPEFLLWLLLFWALHCNNFSFHFLNLFISVLEKITKRRPELLKGQVHG